MRRTWLLVIGLAAVGLAAAAPAADGRRLYLRQCAPCHGVSGRGDGPDAALFAMHPRDLRDGVLARHSTEALVRRVRSGAPLQLAVDPAALRRRAAAVEALVAYLQRLPAIDWPRADRGWVLYAERCAICHGPYGTPLAPPPAGAKPARSLASRAFQSAVSDETLVEVVRHGRDAMPALVPRLSDEEARDVATYVRLFSPGFETYSGTCAGCHGDHGVPSGDRMDGVPQPTVVFSAQYFARHDSEALRSAIWHMLDEQAPVMPHHAAVLTDAEARAIVEYLRRSP
jgi:mono/diheme cytochrome c family protein